jgi:hypothetical protein
VPWKRGGRGSDRISSSPGVLAAKIAAIALAIAVSAADIFARTSSRFFQTAQGSSTVSHRVSHA